MTTCTPHETWFARTLDAGAIRPFAYFSPEFGLHESLPIYSGGLGILAGDHCKEASDLGLPLVGVGFLYPRATSCSGSSRQTASRRPSTTS